MTLREAAQRTSRSITTLRRYIRRGRLRAAKRPGRFGPEYTVSDRDLVDAGLTTEQDAPAPTRRAAERRALAAPAEAAGLVSLALYEELQMKHEQLLVQYGMMRVGGLRALELRGELEAAKRELEAVREDAARQRDEHERDAGRLRRMLREAELELERRGIESGALREKLAALEMLGRNAATNRSIEEQFRRVVTQARRVDDLAGRAAGESPRSVLRPALRVEPEH